MTLSLLLVVVALGPVSLFAEKLERSQHTALMAVYDNCDPPLSTSRFPRFGPAEECAGSSSRIQCSGGKVTRL